MIRGINHITLAVRDLERSFEFYRAVGCRPLARWSTGAYLLAGDLWLCLSVDATTRTAALPEYTHIALDVPADKFDAACRRVHDAGATIWRENRSEGPSVYFLDPDGHKLELHVGDWRTRLVSMKAAPWEPGIVFFDDAGSPHGATHIIPPPRRGGG